MISNLYQAVIVSPVVSRKDLKHYLGSPIIIIRGRVYRDDIAVYKIK